MFCGYFDINAFTNVGVDSIVTRSKRIPKSKSQALKKIGENDLLIQWKKPQYSKASSFSKEQWQNLPKTLTLRQIKVNVQNPEFRVQSFYIVNSLLDAQIYTVKDISNL